MELYGIILEQYLASKGLRPSGARTLQGQDAFGRIDVVVSETIAAFAGRNVITSIAHQVLRPMVDAEIEKRLGPQVILGQLTKHLSPQAAAEAAIAMAKYAESHAPKGAKKALKATSVKAQKAQKTLKAVKSSKSPKRALGVSIIDVTLQPDGTFA